MPPPTRKQSNIPANILLKDDLDKDAIQDTQVTTLLSTIPPELQKNVVEYVSVRSFCSSFMLETHHG